MPAWARRWKASSISTFATGSCSLLILSVRNCVSGLGRRLTGCVFSQLQDSNIFAVCNETRGENFKIISMFTITKSVFTELSFKRSLNILSLLPLYTIHEGNFEWKFSKQFLRFHFFSFRLLVSSDGQAWGEFVRNVTAIILLSFNFWAFYENLLWRGSGH